MSRVLVSGLSPIRLAGLLGIVAVTALTGACSKENEAGNPSLLGSDNGYGKGRGLPGSPEEFKSGVGDLVYFASDSSDLTPEASQTLTQQARWLKQYPQHTVTIEGHADERGTREYNLALGARRAQSVRNFLASQGVPHARMRTISYGKERPVAMCNDISCWSQNRRAQTVLGGAAISQR